MFRKILGAVAILVLSLGFVVADEIKGKVKSVDGTKVTVANKKDGEKTIDIAGAKIQKKGKDGVVAADASAIQVGVAVAVTYDGGKASEVTIMAGKKKDNK